MFIEMASNFSYRHIIYIVNVLLRTFVLKESPENFTLKSFFRIIGLNQIIFEFRARTSGLLLVESAVEKYEFDIKYDWKVDLKCLVCNPIS